MCYRQICRVLLSVFVVLCISCFNNNIYYDVDSLPATGAIFSVINLPAFHCACANQISAAVISLAFRESVSSNALTAHAWLNSRKSMEKWEIFRRLLKLTEGELCRKAYGHGHSSVCCYGELLSEMTVTESEYDTCM